MSQRFLVAPDSFKGTFGAAEVAEAIAGGLEEGGAEAERCPVADGGEGTMAVLLAVLGGERRRVAVHDPLRRPREASFGLLGDGATAIVETAQASGLPLVAPEERDPERADTFGTGEMIAAAVAAGARRVLLAVSGGLWAYGARLRPGAAFVLDAIGFDQRLARADAAVSGEGRLDSQSLGGKVVGEIAARCAAAGKPLHLVVGEDALAGERPAAVAAVVEAGSLAAMRRASAFVLSGSIGPKGRTPGWADAG